LVWWRQHEDQQIKQEYQDVQILDTRFQLKMCFLNAYCNLLTTEEHKKAKQNLIQNHARCILRTLLKERNASGFIKLFQLSNFNIYQLFSGFKGYA